MPTSPRPPSEELRSLVLHEWRDLGFFTASDEGAAEIRIVGSRSGLSRFAALLRTYAGDARHAGVSEHEHVGPHFLKVMTWPEAAIDAWTLRGPVDELARLADLVDTRLRATSPGASIRIEKDWAPASTHALVLDVREDDFDPASLEEPTGLSALVAELSEVDS